MKKIYRTDEKGIHMCEVDDDYVMKDGDLLAPQTIVPVPTFEQKMLMQQAQQITVLQTMVMQQDQDNVKLQKANAEQASQIKQLQQIFMKADQQQAIEKSKEVTAQ